MTSDQAGSKLDHIRTVLVRLDELAALAPDEFLADFRNVAATTYLLQTAVQALIDLGGYIVSKRALPTPRTSQQVFERLEEAGLLPPGTAASVVPIVGFRNRVVHLYDRVDERRVHEILVQHRQDLVRLLHQLVIALDAGS